jgi:hypothetical protein
VLQRLRFQPNSWQGRAGRRVGLRLSRPTRPRCAHACPSCRPLLTLTSAGTPNPAARGRLHGGGEYGGAVAVAGGLADLALAVDELGSARVPAACCGAYALRTTAGVLPLEGAASACASLAAPALLAADPSVLLRAGQALRLPGGERRLCPATRGRRCRCRCCCCCVAQVQAAQRLCGPCWALPCSHGPHPAWPAPQANTPNPPSRPPPNRRLPHRGAALPGGRGLVGGLRGAAAGRHARPRGGGQGARVRPAGRQL